MSQLLASLPETHRSRFRQWMRTYFGFEIFPQSVGDGARVALRIKDGVSGTEINLADAGFGFSQMLPFLVQVWSLTEGRELQYRRVYGGFPPRLPQFGPSGTYIIAIEQPELHLHPALQSRLADLIVAMCAVSRKQNVPIRFFLETHSQTIIDRVGESVESGAVKREDMQVVLFELDRSKPNTQTS